jgi:hypothetical protein
MGQVHRLRADAEQFPAAQRCVGDPVWVTPSRREAASRLSPSLPRHARRAAPSPFLSSATPGDTSSTLTTLTGLETDSSERGSAAGAVELLLTRAVP